MTDTPTEQLDPVLASLVEALEGIGREDLADRAHAARVRASRPSTVVCVVGEFKQGKSSLVNGLVGHAVCPVDDDIATARITLVRHGEQPRATVRLRVDGQAATREVPIAEVAEYIIETDEHDERRDIDRVEIEVPSGVLADGLVLVDTPGMGGLGAGHAAATLSFLPFADGVVLASDATRELTAPEVEFLERARELCPSVVLAETKTDLSPEWRRITDLDRAHLSARGLDLDIVPVSTALRHEALDARDRDLNEASGYPALLDVLGRVIIDPARDGAVARSASEAVALADTALGGLRTELASLEDPALLEGLQAEADDAIARLERLRSGGSRWSIVLNDRTTDVSQDVNHRFRGRMRQITQEIESEIETLGTADEWEREARRLQSLVADAVTTAFVTVEEQRFAIRDELATLLAAEDGLPAASSRAAASIDVSALWRSRDLDPRETSSGKVLRTGMTGLRGAQGGILLFGVSGQFLPQATALFLASNPVLLGAGAFFGGFQLFEDRKRRIQQRRQAARTQLRQFVDDVQFEVGNELATLVRSVQRDLRDEFGELIGELQRTWTDTAKRAQEAMAVSESERDRRKGQVTAAVTMLEAVVDRLPATAEVASE